MARFYKTRCISVKGIETSSEHSISAGKRFNAKQAVGIGVLLVVVGCLSVLFNAADLAVGTGISANSALYDGTNSLRSLSRISFGLVSHGIWCGVMVSTTYFIFCTITLPRSYFFDVVVLLANISG